MAVDGSGGLLPFQNMGDKVIQKLIDIGVDRYWAELPNIEDRKIARGSHNFLLGAALEPQRLEKAIHVGYEIFDQSGKNPLYVSAMSAGNDLSTETLIKNLYEIPGIVSSANSPIEFMGSLSKLDFSGDHPFDYLEQFGGYEMATIVGMILAAHKKSGILFLEGWSALAALAVAYKLNNKVVDNCRLVHCPESEICRSYVQANGPNPIFENIPEYEGGFFIERVVGDLNLA